MEGPNSPGTPRVPSKWRLAVSESDKRSITLYEGKNGVGRCPVSRVRDTRVSRRHVDVVVEGERVEVEVVKGGSRCYVGKKLRRWRFNCVGKGERIMMEAGDMLQLAVGASPLTLIPVQAKNGVSVKCQQIAASVSQSPLIFTHTPPARPKTDGGGGGGGGVPKSINFLNLIERFEREDNPISAETPQAIFPLPSSTTCSRSRNRPSRSEIDGPCTVKKGTEDLFAPDIESQVIAYQH